MVFFSILLLILTEKSAVIPGQEWIVKIAVGYVGNFHEKNVICHGRALRKVEVNPLLWTCEIPGAQNMIYIKKTKIFQLPRSKLKLGAMVFQNAG